MGRGRKREQLTERNGLSKGLGESVSVWCLVIMPPFCPQCHEFTDELTFSEALGAVSLGSRTSRSTSVSSQPVGAGSLLSSCCPRRAKRRAIRLANSTAVSRGSMQEAGHTGRAAEELCPSKDPHLLCPTFPREAQSLDHRI